MTWYASHIYAQPTPDVQAAFAAHPVLSQGMYWLTHLDHFPWPDGPQARYDKPHGLPPDGLLVMRELCAPGTREFAYHRQNALAWEGIVGPQDALVMSLSHLPTSSNGVTYYDSEWAGQHPPKPFLKFLKHVSRKTHTVVVFYHHASGAEQSAQQELAWVFGEEDYVLAAYIPDYHFMTRFTPDATTEIPQLPGGGKTVLQVVLAGFGLELPSRYFAPHTWVFDWKPYQVKG